jgi:hypothetical protein
MIPLLAIVHVRHPDGAFRLWAPLFLIWPLLVLLAAVLSPILLLAALVSMAAGFNAFRWAGALIAVICNLSGLQVQVQSPGARVLVQIV